MNRAIVDVLTRSVDPEATAQEIADRAGYSVGPVRKKLNQLVEGGTVNRAHNGQRGGVFLYAWKRRIEISRLDYQRFPTRKGK